MTAAQSPAPVAAISVQRISKHYPGAAAPALRAVTLDIRPGTRTAILGPSGSGKSTLLRLIAGLEQPSGGRILLNGADVSGVLPENRDVGMVFQRPLLFPHLSVADNVAFALRATGLPRRRARAVALQYLQLVQLPDMGDRAVSTLSGGQQQRVAIARTLAARPAVLLLDEPFSALDPALRDDMHRLLDHLGEQLPPTMVLVTHDRDEAAAIADRIAVIEHGELLQHDTVEQIYHRPVSLAVSRLLGGCNAIAGVVAGGEHRSDLGTVPVPVGTTAGPGTLVIRPEVIQVLPGISGVDAGAVPSETSPDRHPAGSGSGQTGPGGGGSAGGWPGGDWFGAVVAITRQGARQRLQIRRGAATITADAPPGFTPAVGDPVTLRFAPTYVTVFPTP